jgi:hypothetical protein
MSTDFNSVRKTSTEYIRRFGRTSTEYSKRFGEDLLAALLYPFQSILRVPLALILAGLTFVVLILASQPFAVFSAFVDTPSLMVDIGYIEPMVMMGIDVLINTKGWGAVVMTVAYALLTGIALTNMVAQLRMLQVSSISSVGGIIPGLFAAGCASCGPGLFALLGFTGAITAIPFQGMVLRLGGIGMFLFFLGLSGDPRECRID